MMIHLGMILPTVLNALLRGLGLRFQPSSVIDRSAPFLDWSILFFHRPLLVPVYTLFSFV
jgi:hypothetical protein